MEYQAATFLIVDDDQVKRQASCAFPRWRDNSKAAAVCHCQTLGPVRQSQLLKPAAEAGSQHFDGFLKLEACATAILGGVRDVAAGKQLKADAGRQQRCLAILPTDRQTDSAAFVPAGLVNLEGHVSDLPLPTKQVQAHELGDLGEVVSSAR